MLVFYSTEKLANTERYIDQGKLHALRAEDKTDELKKLNRSIFRPAITFNKDAKRAAQEAKVAARYDEERASRERGMADVRESKNRLGQATSYGVRQGEGEDEFGEENIGRRRIRSPEEQRNRQESRKRYQFEKTASDDELEDEMDDNLDEIGDAAKRLKAIAMAAGEELDRQSDRIDNIATKTGKLNNRVDSTTDRVCVSGICFSLLPLTYLSLLQSSSGGSSRPCNMDYIQQLPFFLGPTFPCTLHVEYIHDSVTTSCVGLSSPPNRRGTGTILNHLEPTPLHTFRKCLCYWPPLKVSIAT